MVLVHMITSVEYSATMTASKRDPQRRNLSPDWVQLPADGRRGPTPEWPITSVDVSSEVLDIWDDLWHTPQATEWERLRWTRTVARYAILLPSVENPLVRGSKLSEIRALEESLGLTPKSLKMLQWEITRKPEGSKPASETRWTQLGVNSPDSNVVPIDSMSNLYGED